MCLQRSLVVLKVRRVDPEQGKNFPPIQTHSLHPRYAIVTLDGTVLLVDQGTKDPMDSIMWNLQVGVC